MKTKKKIIVYYGASGHGKGLVDAMSGFGVKGPLRKAVVTEDFFYNSAEEIHTFLTNRFTDDHNKHYFLVNSDITSVKRELKVARTIDSCQKLHMIAFNADGTIQKKVNLCSCEMCLTGDFLRCPIEAGVKISYGNMESEDEDSCDEDPEGESEAEDDDVEFEELELRAECVFDVIEVGSYVALFSAKSSFELFYICKVIAFGTAENDIYDSFNHAVLKGTRFIECNYLEKIKEKKSNVYYKIIPKTVLVHPSQVMAPAVNVQEDLSLTMQEYQWLADCI